jgi:hypothetical protein
MEIKGALNVMDHFFTSSFGDNTKLMGESVLKMNNKIEIIR